MLRVKLLGALALEVDGRPLDLPASRRARSLLGLLAIERRTHPRGQLAARFWPDVLDESARTSLRSALSALRRALGAEADAGLRHGLAELSRGRFIDEVHALGGAAIDTNVADEAGASLDGDVLR